MKKAKRTLAFSLVLALTLWLGGCSTGGNSKYNIISRLGTQQLCIAFRDGDRAGDAVIAALAVLQADGTVEKISRDWFGENRSKLKGDENALDALDMEIAERSFNMGYDASHMPYSGTDRSGLAVGFDIDLAKAVFEKLGWRVRFLAVDVGKADIELKSGNVDCIWGGYAMPESASGLRFSPVYMTNTVIAASLSSSGISREKDLENATLAVCENGQFSQVLDASPDFSARPAYVIKLPGGSDDCLKALDEGSCNVVITDIAAIDYHR